ncbi:acyl-CoA N-acyltransferase [Cadophora sp. MPI-SDFR-AT-0126]|nr:acyl-CoA N-acyltransferase [Leotiomycetes sp. MPI-SDFR-AT-0126]
MTESPEFKVSLVIRDDLPSIGTLHARAFHTKSDWHRKVFPLSISPWWEAKYALDIPDPTSRLLKISPVSSPHTVTGLLSLRKYTTDERGAGRWSSFPPPPEVDRETYKAMIDAMIEYREKYMFGKEHFCVDHFGVDSAVQGKGLGSILLGRACEIADAEGLDIFVQANEFAESFYQRFGFKTEGTLVMPGGLTECFLVRRSGGS